MFARGRCRNVRAGKWLWHPWRILWMSDVCPTYHYTDANDKIPPNSPKQPNWLQPHFPNYWNIRLEQIGKFILWACNSLRAVVPNVNSQKPLEIKYYGDKSITLMEPFLNTSATGLNLVKATSFVLNKSSSGQHILNMFCSYLILAAKQNIMLSEVYCRSSELTHMMALQSGDDRKSLLETTLLWHQPPRF